MSNINKYTIGQTAEESIQITDTMIHEIAHVSNDYNPIHMSDEYAAKTPFGKRIAHGLICEGLISNIIGTKLPGPGAIFINISIDFCRPVYCGDTITAKGIIQEIIEEKSIMLIEVTCYNQASEKVVNSVSKVKLLDI